MSKSHFFGRVDALKSLSEFDVSDSPILQVSGGPGIGKSALLGEWSRLKTYPIVDLSGKDDLEGALSWIARSTDIRLPKMDLETLAIQLKSAGITMLILDDLDVFPQTPNLLKSLKEIGIRVIWSARKAHENGLLGSLHVAPMTTEGALNLLIEEGKPFWPDIEKEFKQDPKSFENLVIALECIPLALRLIAPRFRSLNPNQMLAYLDKLSVLVDPKSKTLEHAFLSSWEVLDADAQELLALCTAFRGGFEREAILTLSDNLEKVLASLIESSLLEQDSKTGRLRMLWSIRDFAIKHHVCEVSEKYAQYYVNLVESGEDVEALRKEEFNIRHILRSFLKRDPDLSGRAALALFFLRSALGPYDDLSEAMRLVVDEFEHCEDQEMMMTVLGRLGELERKLGHYSQSLSYFFRALKLGEKRGPSEIIAGINMAASISHRMVEDLEKAEASAAIASQMYNQLGLMQKANDALIALASVNIRAGELEKATARLKRVLVSDPESISATTNIGGVYLLAGDAVQARKYLEQSYILAQAKPTQQLSILNNLVQLDLFDGKLELAYQKMVQSRKLVDETQSKTNLGSVLINEGMYHQIRRDFSTSFTSYTNAIETLTPVETQRLFRLSCQRGIVAALMSEENESNQDLKNAELIYLHAPDKHDFIYLKCLRWINNELYFAQPISEMDRKSINMKAVWNELFRCFSEQKAKSHFDSWFASCSVFRGGFTLDAATTILEFENLLIDKLDERVESKDLIRTGRGSKLRYENAQTHYFECISTRKNHLSYFAFLVARSILPSSLIVEGKNLQSALYFAAEYLPEKVNEMAHMLWLVTGEVHGVPESIKDRSKFWLFVSIGSDDIVLFSKEVLSKNTKIKSSALANIYYFFAVIFGSEHVLDALNYLEKAVSLWPEALHIRTQLALVCSISNFPLKTRHALGQLIASATEKNLVPDLWTHIQERSNVFHTDPKLKEEFLNMCEELEFPVRITHKKIVVDQKRKTVRIEQNDIIDMRRKGTAWRLILALVRQRDKDPGKPISQPDLFEVVWPGEQFGPTTSSRMYTAIHRIRENVLGEILVTEEDGYFLKASCEIEYVDT